MAEAELAVRGVKQCSGRSIGRLTASLAGIPQFSRRQTADAISSDPSDYDCGDFRSGAKAHRFFLESGGPTRDLFDLDRDGDGLACEWAQKYGVSRLIHLHVKPAQFQHINRRAQRVAIPVRAGEPSVAELGAFAMVEEIALRLLVVMDDKNYSDPSFLKLGPVRRLERKYGNSAVCVLSRQDINIPDITNVADVDLDNFAGTLHSAIVKRKADYKERTTFNSERPGHLIKLIVGLIQH